MKYEKTFVAIDWEQLVHESEVGEIGEIISEYDWCFGSEQITLVPIEDFISFIEDDPYLNDEFDLETPKDIRSFASKTSAKYVIL